MKQFCLLVILAGSYLQLYPQEQPAVYLELERNYNENSFEACIRMAKQVQSFTHNRIDTLAANSFFFLGDAYNQIGETRKALHYFELQKEILATLKLQHTTDFSNTLNNLAYLYLQEGDYARAGSIADNLIANDRLLFPPTSDEYVSTVIYVTDIYIQLDRIKDAEHLLGATLRPQDKRSINRGILLNKLGDLYSYSGQYTRASRTLTEAIDLLGDEAGEESAEFISTAINLGILFMSQGKYPEAEEIFETALSKVNESEPAYASLLNNQALVLQSLGQLQRAEETLLAIRGRDSVDLGTTHPDFAITLSNLGLVYADQSKFERAEAVLKKALVIQRENGEATATSFARKLNNLARVYQMNGAPVKAIPLLEQAMAIFRKNMGKESPEYATSAYNLGVALWKAGKGPAGYKHLRISADIRLKRLGKNHPKYAESILKIAEYQWETRSIREAQRSFGDVFDNYFYQIDETFPVLTEEEKSKFYYTNIRPSFDKFNSFAVEHQSEDPAMLKQAYDYLINTKAAIMFATEKVRTSILASDDPVLITQFEEWQAAKEQIAKLYSLNQEHPQLDSLLTATDALEKELARKSAHFSGQFVKRKITHEHIQKALKPGEAAVEVLRFQKYNPKGGGAFIDDTNYGFLVITGSAGSPVFISMPAGDDMETKFLRYYRNNIKFNLPDAASYEHYFKPMADYLKENEIHRVFLSADGVYNQINISSIQNPETTKFLIDEFDIRLVTNTREIVEVTTPGKTHQSSTLIGFPKFNLGDGELPSQEKNAGTRGTGSRAWRGGLLRYMRGEEGISILPGTRVEISKIAALFGDATAVHMETEASERIAKNVNNPRVLHIATHGYFLEDAVAHTSRQTYFSNPLLNAGLMLAGAENFLRTGEPINEHGDDGILTAFEAMNLKLDDTELVVLSACETALGNVKNGEGVYGLQRALKLAGARSIVMSLWNVDDEATQQLMTTFYEEMLKTGDQHLAFRAAQQKVKEKFPSPFYWGAFVMVGI